MSKKKNKNSLKELIPVSSEDKNLEKSFLELVNLMGISKATLINSIKYVMLLDNKDNKDNNNTNNIKQKDHIENTTLLIENDTPKIIEHETPENSNTKEEYKKW